MSRDQRRAAPEPDGQRWAEFGWQAHAAREARKSRVDREVTTFVIVESAVLAVLLVACLESRLGGRPAGSCASPPAERRRPWVLLDDVVTA